MDSDKVAKQYSFWRIETFRLSASFPVVANAKSRGREGPPTWRGLLNQVRTPTAASFPGRSRLEL